MTPANRQAQVRERLVALLAPAVEPGGYDLEDVSVSSAGRRTLVRVIVDADGGIDLDAVAEVSRAVSDVLDSHDELFPGAYVLEVSSPGVDRPLTEGRHWRRAVGRLVEVPVAGQQVTGRVTAADESGITLSVDGHSRQVGWDTLGTGRVRVEFNHAADADDEVDEPAEEDD